MPIVHYPGLTALPGLRFRFLVLLCHHFMPAGCLGASAAALLRVADVLTGAAAGPAMPWPRSAGLAYTGDSYCHHQPCIPIHWSHA